MQSRNFRLQKVGDSHWLEKHYQFQKISFSIDEIIILNASRQIKLLKPFADTINRLSNNVFIPIAAGGGIRKMEDAEILFNYGADKIVLNYMFINHPKLVEDLVKKYGSQSIIASIDYKNVNGINEVLIQDGTERIEMTLENYIQYVENLGVGEIILNSIDKDGTGFGYDLETINSVKNKIKVPLIISGGAGNENHLLQGLALEQVSGVSTANLFNFLGDSLPNARKKIINAGVNIAAWG